MQASVRVRETVLLFVLVLCRTKRKLAIIHLLFTLCWLPLKTDDAGIADSRCTHMLRIAHTCVCTAVCCSINITARYQSLLYRTVAHSLINASIAATNHCLSPRKDTERKVDLSTERIEKWAKQVKTNCTQINWNKAIWARNRCENKQPIANSFCNETRKKGRQFVEMLIQFFLKERQRRRTTASHKCESKYSNVDHWATAKEIFIYESIELQYTAPFRHWQPSYICSISFSFSFLRSHSLRTTNDAQSTYLFVYVHTGREEHE